MSAKKHFIGGYGTLLYEKSLNKTIMRKNQSVHPLVRYTPFIVKGYQRIFNLSAEHYQPSHKLQSSSSEIAAANLQPSEAHAFNGLGFHVSSEELELIDSRESYYARKEVFF